MFCGEGFHAEGAVRLLGATIGGVLDLTGGSFTNPDGHAISADEADITALRLLSVASGSIGTISLVGAHVGALQDRPEPWRAFRQVSILDMTYDRIAESGWRPAHWIHRRPADRLRWLRQSGDYQAQPYEQLARTLRAQGRERDARTILIAKHREGRRREAWPLRIGQLLFDGLLAYGYRPLQRTLPALLGLYLIGALWLLPAARAHHAIVATRAPIHSTTASPAAAGAAKNPASATPITATTHCRTDYACFSPWAYSADVLIPLINTHQTDYWTITSATRSGRDAIVYARISTVLGWALSTAAALGFTGLIRRD